MSLELQAQAKLKEESEAKEEDGFFKKLQIPFAKRDKRSISPCPSVERRDKPSADITEV